MSKDDIHTVTLAGVAYKLTESVRFSVALDVLNLTAEGRAGYLRAGAVALYERCPTLRARLGLGPYRGDPRDFGGAVLDALVDPAARGGKARESDARATQAEVYAAIGVAMQGALDALGGTEADEVEAEEGNSDATP